jgi:hypothetical protein|tara:strand:+ start:612 stop:1592 length:981 start_codon:yes stop_codon:yes gene_type:complete
MHKFYIEDLLEVMYENYSVIYGHEINKNIGKKYFYIKQGYLKFILNINLFVSNNLCEVFPPKSKKIFIDHNIYDDPWIPQNKERETCQRFLKYNFVFLSSEIKIKAASEMFRKNNFEKFPNLKEIGYPKIDYLQKKYPEKLKMKKNSIVIAPTLFEGFPEFTILDYLKDIIYELLNSTSYNIILRPHPGNRNHTKVYELIKLFKNNTRFQCDSSENYIDTYAKSQILITDISGTAYTYAFLTLCPVIFFLPNDDKIKKYNYDKLNFFINITKIGSIVRDVKLMSQEINKILLKIKQYKESIQILKREIKYLGKAKKKFKEELDLIN